MADALDPRPTPVIFAEVWAQRDNIKKLATDAAAKVAAVSRTNPNSPAVANARNIAAQIQGAYDNMIAAQTGGTQQNVIDRYRDAQRANAAFTPAIAAAQSAPIVAGSVASQSNGAPTASGPVQPGNWASVASQAMNAATRASSPNGFVATGPDLSTGPRPADSPAFDAPAQDTGSWTTPLLVCGAAAIALLMFKKGKRGKKVRA